MGDQGGTSDIPWASVFDPAANARALSAIQAEGFRAASKLVDRFVSKAEVSGNGHNADVRDTDQDHKSANGSAVNGAAASRNGEVGGDDPGLEQLIKTWWLIAGQFLVGSARMAAAPFVGSAPGETQASLDLGDGRGEGSLALHAETSGRATAEVWLHNRGPHDLGEVTLRCSDLLAHDGGVVEAGAIELDPEVVPLPRRSSRGVAVSIALTPRVRPGVYRGTLLAGGNPDLWLPVVLTVRLPGS